MHRIIIIIVWFFAVFVTCKSEKHITIFTIGDSTMANKKAEVYPETGWCQVAGNYFNETVTIKNHAMNGRSSKSFIDEGRWTHVLDSLQKGDFVFIQFGHNDQKAQDTTRHTLPFETYSENLIKFIQETRDKGAYPVLFTSIVRRKFGEDGKLTDTHGDYPIATRKVAAELNVPLIDLQTLTEAFVNRLGDTESKNVYLWTEPNEHFPEGRKDDTHLSFDGANIVAQLAIEAITETIPELSKRKQLNSKK
ncbi:rhamnogalacturonan acetylesterase [Mangrovibacterium sp.]|uniref:rhamnogalacturonan acetylesterase n=1 Tax=Mangrovibacterium sp. TaxID=1961364 RepID=UPI003564142B